MDDLPVVPINTSPVSSVPPSRAPAVAGAPKVAPSNPEPQTMASITPPAPTPPSPLPVPSVPETPKVETVKPRPSPPPPPVPPLSKKKQRWFLTGCLGVLLFVVLCIVTIFILALTSPTGELVLDSADLMPVLIPHASPSATPSAKEASPSALESGFTCEPSYPVETGPELTASADYSMECAIQRTELGCGSIDIYNKARNDFAEPDGISDCLWVSAN